ncbi:MAG: 16S rRNA (guanine(966)-N(2))-methyltransferase RsmD [Pseudomonadota bacterium]
MRIVGGRFRGRPIAAPAPGDRRIRPTTDRVRESLFNLIAHRAEAPDLETARVLDLFAGTGALGFEALSRGAAHVTFVERARPALRLIRETAAALDVAERVTILAADATRAPVPPGAVYDLIFLDPPYGRDLGAAALTAVATSFAPGALVVWEEMAEMPAVADLQRIDCRRYGDTVVTLLTASQGA